jgi:CheY-like chemotaxis protein
MSQHAPSQLVLLVEDDPDLSEVVSALLEAEGYTVATARHGQHALLLLDGGVAPSVIVCDMMMPVLDGFGFLAAYGTRPHPRVPVIAVSAFDGYLAGARDAGADVTLAKPYDADALVAAVRRHAGPPRPVRAAEPAPEHARDAEDARMREILALRLDEPAPTAALERFAQRVARIFEVPICLVSIITVDRQYWHAFCGLPADLSAARGTPREDSFCTHAVVARAALIVQDAAVSPMFRSNRLVRERGVRFYAGVPLVGRLGDAVGTLCLLDFAPRTFGYFELELLGALSRRVLAELERRERRGAPRSPEAAFRHLGYLDEELDILGREGLVQALVLEALRATERRGRVTVAVAVVPDATPKAEVEALKAAFPRAHLGRLGMSRIGIVVPDAEPDDVRATIQRASPGTRVATEAVRPAPGNAEAQLRDIEGSLGSAGLAPRGP